MPAATRVRIRNPGLAGQWIIGRVESAGPDSILVTDSRGRVHRLKTSNVVWADTLAGTRRRTGDGFFIGFGAGAALGAGLGAATHRPCNDGFLVCGYDISKSTQMIVSGLALGLLGGIVGAAAGHGYKADRWDPLDLPEKAVRPIVRPSRGGLRLGASMRF
jgi:hypothetical protein